MRRYQRGFSLLEMSVVLLIIGIVTGSGMFMLTESLRQKQFNTTKERLALLQQTLLDFRRAFNRLPCPAYQTLAVSTSAFGRENCTPSAPDLYASGPIMSGMFPTKTLGLPDEYAFDGWGRRIVYTVDSAFINANAFNAVPLSDTTVRLVVQNQAGSNKTDRAVYVLVSHGSNGHGAFPRKGGTTRVRATGTSVAGSANTDELENCQCDNNAAYTSLNSTFVQQPINSENTAVLNRTFDDLVVYATRADLPGFAE
jgi:prepilin-type N-terminal cleavage/methylation domain-containing protein